MSFSFKAPEARLLRSSVCFMTYVLTLILRHAPRGSNMDVEVGFVGSAYKHSEFLVLGKLRQLTQPPSFYQLLIPVAISKA